MTLFSSPLQPGASQLQPIITTCVIALASLVDRAVGDPRRMPHVIRGIGALVTGTERPLRAKLAKTSQGERLGGALLVIVVLIVVGAGSLALLEMGYLLSLWLGPAWLNLAWLGPVWLGVVETVICFQCLAVKSLKEESTKVQTSLTSGDLVQARRDLAMIVGRDTDELDESAVVRATVETVAENTSDGVVGPLVAMMIAGGFGGLLYKAINTMDSMVGYRNEQYMYFGRAAARLDDAVNWLPSRLTACLMVIAAGLTRCNWRAAWYVWRRDRASHASPNSGQVEAACAGAIQIQLGGPATYSGQHHDKPLIGDPTRMLCASDIAQANRLMSVTSWLALALVVGVRIIALEVIMYAT